MYAKLVANRLSTGSGWDFGSAFSAITGVINGTITNTSQLGSTYWTPAASIITGTRPSSGIYAVSAVAVGSSFANFTVTKYHYARGQGSLQARTVFHAVWDTSFGFRGRYSDLNSQNMIPNPSSSFYVGSPSSSSQALVVDNTSSNMLNWASLREIHLIITDHIMVMQVQTGSLEAESDYLTYILSDIEYVPSIDNYAYQANNRYSPQVCNWFLWLDTMDRAAGNGTSWTAGTSRIQYMDQYGSFRNTTISDVNATAHYTGSNNNNAMILTPRPYERIIRLPLSNGDFVNQLVPVFTDGSQSPTDQLGDPRRGKLMSFFRTTDDIGRTGTIITDGVQNYRVFAVHKTGASTPTTSAHGVYNACYAFPENNIPFGA